MHTQLIPPAGLKESDFQRDDVPWSTEWDVLEGLKKLGHNPIPVGVICDLQVIKDAIDEHRPNLVYNLLEEFDGDTLLDQNIVSYLELLKIPYTGCNPRGLIIARDKALAKKIMSFHKIKTPQFQVFQKNKKTKKQQELKFPMIVKCLTEEASLGISKASVVHSEEKLLDRVSYIHKKIGDDAIVEEFVEGREFYVGIIGNKKLTAFPVWELTFKNVDSPEKEFYTNRAKWNSNYRKRKGIKTEQAKLSKEKESEIQTICKEVYKNLKLSGYARIDLRMDIDENIYIIEANPNPDIARIDEFAFSAKYIGLEYTDLLSEILKLAKSY